MEPISPEAIANRRIAVTNMLTRLEQAAAALDAQAQGHANNAQQAGGQMLMAIIAILVGLISIPLYGIGLLLIAAGVFAFGSQFSRRSNSQQAQADARKAADQLRTRTIPLKNALAVAGEATIDDVAFTNLLGGPGWDVLT